MATTTERTSVEMRRPRWQIRAAAVGAAIVVNVLILGIGRLVNGEFPVAEVNGDEQTIGFGPVIFATALLGLAAWGLLELLERTTARAVTIWIAIAVIFFIASLLGPLDGGVNTSSKVVLACLHFGAAATIISLMLRSAAAHD